jgi:uncharacterized damage-inducible protein DinB
MTNLLARMFHHMEWSNTVILDALRAQTEPDPEALRLFAHILGAEEVWLSRIGQRASRQAVWPSLSLSECAALAATNRDAFAALVSDISDADLERSVRYSNSAGFEFENTLVDILTHVALHGSYHRGQIARQLRASGTAPPYTDYIAYVRRDQPGGTLDAGRVSETRLMSQVRSSG